MSQEINDVLDQLEVDQLDAKSDVLLTENKAVEAEDPIEQVETKPKEKPPGFLSYDEWVAKGKDPADYKGENAYKAEYERIQEIRDLKNTMNTVVHGMEAWKEQQIAQTNRQIAEAKADAQRELELAQENYDIDAALRAKDKISELDRQIVNTPPPLNPVITDFARKNPIIDQNSPQYDKEFHQDMIMIHNGKLDLLLGGDRSRAGELTPQQIDRVQRLAYQEAQNLHADKFASPKNQRKTVPQPTKRAATNHVDVTSSLKSIKNTRNPNDSSAAMEIYELIKATDPQAAETFAKNVIGE